MRKPASDSIRGQLEAAQAAEFEYYVPQGLPELTELERTYWDLYLTAKNAWKDSELVELHTLVKMKAELAEMASDPDSTHTERTSQAKLIQGQLRVMGLNTPQTVAATVARQGNPSSNRGKRTPPAPEKSVSLIR